MFFFSLGPRYALQSRCAQTPANNGYALTHASSSAALTCTHIRAALPYTNTLQHIRRKETIAVERLHSKKYVLGQQ